MANYRQIHVSIWKDDWFLDLDRGEKLFFIYLFSNELASLAGIYKLPLRVMAFETGLDILEVQNYLDKFEKDDKVYYRGGIIWVKNLRKYNTGGATVQTRIEKDLSEIPYCKLKAMYLLYHPEYIPYGYTIDRVSYEMKCNEMNPNEEEGKKPRRKRTATPSPSPDSPDAKSEITPQQAIFGALADVTGMDRNINAGRLGKSASGLLKGNYSPEFIRQHYSPGGWWYLNDWRGQKGGLPTPEQVIETIGRVALPVVINGKNGHHPAPPSTPYERSKAALAEAMQEMQDE